MVTLSAINAKIINLFFNSDTTIKGYFTANRRYKHISVVMYPERFSTLYVTREEITRTSIGTDLPGSLLKKLNAMIIGCTDSVSRSDTASVL